MGITVEKKMELIQSLRDIKESSPKDLAEIMRAVLDQPEKPKEYVHQVSAESAELMDEIFARYEKVFNALA